LLASWDFVGQLGFCWQVFFSRLGFCRRVGILLAGWDFVGWLGFRWRVGISSAEWDFNFWQIEILEIEDLGELGFSAANNFGRLVNPMKISLTLQGYQPLDPEFSQTQ
jgi:hypothetical protein